MKPTPINKKVSTQKKGTRSAKPENNGPRRGVKLSKILSNLSLFIVKNLFLEKKGEKKPKTKALQMLFTWLNTPASSSPFPS